MSLYLPDQVVDAVEAYIATLVPLASYAPWADAAWTPSEVPFHLEREPGSYAPLAFSVRDDSHDVEGYDATTVRYTVRLETSFIFPILPAAGADCWAWSALASHHLLAHLLRRTSAAPVGIVPLATRAMRFSRVPIPGDRLLCSLSLAAFYEAPLTWE